MKQDEAKSLILNEPRCPSMNANQASMRVIFTWAKKVHWFFSLIQQIVHHFCTPRFAGPGRETKKHSI